MVFEAAFYVSSLLFGLHSSGMYSMSRIVHGMHEKSRLLRLQRSSSSSRYIEYRTCMCNIVGRLLREEDWIIEVQQHVVSLGCTHDHTECLLDFVWVILLYSQQARRTICSMLRWKNVLDTISVFNPYIITTRDSIWIGKYYCVL